MWSQHENQFWFSQFTYLCESNLVLKSLVLGHRSNETSAKCIGDCCWLQVTKSACHLWPPRCVQVCALQQRPSDLPITATCVSCWTQTHRSSRSGLLKTPFMLFVGISFLWLLPAACNCFVKCAFCFLWLLLPCTMEVMTFVMYVNDRKEQSLLRRFTVN